MSFCKRCTYFVSKDGSCSYTGECAALPENLSERKTFENAQPVVAEPVAFDADKRADFLKKIAEAQNCGKCVFQNKTTGDCTYTNGECAARRDNPVVQEQAKAMVSAFNPETWNPFQKGIACLGDEFCMTEKLIQKKLNGHTK